MSHDSNIRNLVQEWCQNNPAHRAIAYSENRLFRMLYDAYCQRSGEENLWKKFSSKADYRDACSKLFAWYRNTYEIRFQMPAGGKGQKRVASPDKEKYTFHLRYSDSRSFKQYLVEGQYISGSQTLLSFVLHTAVAFLVPPDQLDHVLQRLGFHPLHVKNIHHLAIYYVLLDAANRKNDPAFNPFEQIRDLYFRAHEILAKPGPIPTDAYRYDDRLTWMIRKELFLQKAISNENFEKLVLLNKDSLNMRHSMILKDFSRLTSVFFHVFDDHRFSTESPMEADSAEENYSFYAFVGRYCHEYLSRKKYREWLSGKIEREEKHPTRNMMILLWLYAYCFAYLPSIYVDNTAYNRIENDLRTADPALAASIKSFYKFNRLDVYGLISGIKGRKAEQMFQGEEIIAEINAKLMEYGWGPLDDKLPFDHYIMQLRKLDIWLDPSDDCMSCMMVKYGDASLTGIPTRADNVPCPLVVITWIMHHLKAVHLLNPAFSPCPLECNLYEQI